MNEMMTIETKGYLTAHGVDTAERIVRTRMEQQLKLLSELYRELGGRTDAPIRAEEVQRCANRARLSADDAYLALDRLCNDGLLAYKVADHWMLTLEGAREVEASIARPNDGTDHFPAPVVQHVTNTTNNYQINAPVGALQSGSGNTANVVQNVALGDEVVRAFAGLRQAAQQLQGEDRQEAEELIDALEEQSKSSKPKKSVMKQCATAIGEKLKPIDVVALTGVILRAIEMAQHLPT